MDDDALQRMDEYRWGEGEPNIAASNIFIIWVNGKKRANSNINIVLG